MTLKVREIRSGGQTGADQGALYGAKAVGIPTDGWAPLGYRTERGNNLLLRDVFGLKEHPSRDYPPRTRLNVQETDATVLISVIGVPERGTIFTKSICNDLEKPALHIILPTATSGLLKNDELVREFLKEGGYEVVNFAGNRESISPGIQIWTQRLVLAIFASK